jgi:hypothetical protein
MAALAAVGAISGIAKGLVGIAGGIIGSRKRKRRERQAMRAMQKYRDQYEQMDLSNPFADIENPYEDLRVNTQEAEFLAQQQQQGLAATMGALQGAAGGSGIAALAQAMSNQQTQNLQKASASIGQQEAANERMAAQGAMQTQQLIASGEQVAQQRQLDRTGTLLGMSQAELGAARQARQAATKSILSGIGNMVGGVGTLGGQAGWFGDDVQSALGVDPKEAIGGAAVQGALAGIK